MLADVAYINESIVPYRHFILRFVSNSFRYSFLLFQLFTIAPCSNSSHGLDPPLRVVKLSSNQPPVESRAITKRHVQS